MTGERRPLKTAATAWQSEGHWRVEESQGPRRGDSGLREQSVRRWRTDGAPALKTLGKEHCQESFLWWWAEGRELPERRQMERARWGRWPRGMRGMTWEQMGTEEQSTGEEQWGDRGGGGTQARSSNTCKRHTATWGDWQGTSVLLWKLTKGKQENKTNENYVWREIKASHNNYVKH